jgi:D-3-phosphoglycerate dehydrogenase
MNKKILIGVTNFSKYCAKAEQLIEYAGFELIKNPYQRSYTKEELREIDPDVCAVIAGMESWDSETVKYFKQLKIIMKFGVGVDTIDLKAAEENRIIVRNAPGLNSVSVANMTIALMFAVLRKIVMYVNTTKSGKWVRDMADDIDDKTIGIIGFGDIGKKVAKRLSGFDARILAYDINPDKGAAKDLNTEMVSFDKLIEESDIITIHVPNTTSTYHLIGKREFERMKRNAVVINTSRGPVIDEKALIRALETGRIAGAGIDVYEAEPVVAYNPLLKIETAVCTPHVSGETYKAYNDISMFIAREIIDFFNSNKL